MLLRAVSAWKRLFSADFRRALAAEASGEYDDAARAYALAGERAKVAEMHLLRAERIAGTEPKLVELRTGLRWADLDDEEGRAVRLRLAQAIFRQCVEAEARAATVDKALAREAAGLLTELGDFASAAECHRLIGDTQAAADAYQQAGDVDQLERVLDGEAARWKDNQAQRAALEEHELAYVEGDRVRALAALERAVALSTGEERVAQARALAALKERRITDGRVTLRGPLPATTSEALYLGRSTAVLGRDASCDVVLRDAGISRQHAELTFVDGAWQLADRGSKNGTNIGGVPLDRLPLPEAVTGQFGLGELCAFSYRVAEGGVLTLEVARGIDRARRYVIVPRAIALGPLVLTFVDGQPRVSAPGGTLKLNGVQVVGAVQLVRGDQLSTAQDGVDYSWKVE